MSLADAFQKKEPLIELIIVAPKCECGRYCSYRYVSFKKSTTVAAIVEWARSEFYSPADIATQLMRHGDPLGDVKRPLLPETVIGESGLLNLDTILVSAVPPFPY